MGLVNPGMSRGAYPTLRNFRALSRLKLRTIVSLIPESPTEDMQSFAEMEGISIVHIPIQRTMPIGTQLQATLISAINTCIDLDNHPVYVHCLDGRRITSLLVLLLRRLQGWLPLSAIDEYWRYQSSWRSPSISLTEVEKNVREIENFASELSEVIVPERIPLWLWSGVRNVKVQGVRLKHVPPLILETPPTGGANNNNFNRAGTSNAARGGNEPSASSDKEPDVPTRHPAEQESIFSNSNITDQPQVVSRALSALDLHGIDAKSGSAIIKRSAKKTAARDT